MRDNYRNPYEEQFSRRQDVQRPGPNSDQRIPRGGKPKFGLPILILVPIHYMDHVLEPQVQFLERIKDLTRVHHLYCDRNINFESIKCKVLYVNDLNENVKYRASRKIVEHFLVKHMKIDEKDPKAKLSILIPENMCSLFIGKEGRNIKSLMSETRTQLDLHSEQYDAGYRPVDIKGDVYSITFAIEKISQSLESFSDRSERKTDVDQEGEFRYVLNNEALAILESN